MAEINTEKRHLKPQNKTLYSYLFMYNKINKGFKSLLENFCIYLYTVHSNIAF